MNVIKIIGKVATIPKISFAASNIIICRMIIANDEDTFPVICFNSFAEKVNKLCKEGQKLEVKGVLKDYSYLDNNDTIHYTKIVLLKELLINKESKTILSEKETIKNEKIWLMIKQKYQVLDVIDFEKILSKEVVQECFR